MPVRIALTSVVTAVVLVGGGVISGDAALADGHVDTADRASVTEAYNRLWAPSLRVEPGWTGSSSSCDAGRTSDSAQSATLTAINFARDLAGLTPATFVPAYDAQAQAAALMMQANSALSHTPPSTWRCYSDLGAAGAGSSDLYLGRTAANAIAGYLVDPGANNTFVGHRRWILNPDSLTMGHGSTDGSDALKVFGDLGFGQRFDDPQWVPWPTSGWFPAEMEPDGRWSLSGQRSRQYDFSAASVTVRDAAGEALPVRIMPQQDGYGSDTLVWEVSGLQQPAGTGVATYSVDVSGISAGGTPTSTSYTARLFDPEAKAAPAPAPAPAERTLQKAPAITGTAKVGKRLTVSRPVYAPAASVYRTRWYRDGQPIAKAVKPSYTLTKKDRGKVVSVRVTVPASDGFPAAVSRAALPRRVR